MSAGSHPDEGTIHAWLDDALSAAEAAALERHVAACAPCAAAVAEARGLIAASSRILGALDAVPGGVLPAAPADVGPAVPIRRLQATRAWRRWPAQAAAVALLAVGTWTVVQRGDPTAAEVALDDRAVQTTSSAEAPQGVPAMAGDASAGGAEARTGAASVAPVAPSIALDAPRPASRPAEKGAAPEAAVRIPATVTRPPDAVDFVAGGAEERRRARAGAAAADVHMLQARAPGVVVPDTARPSRAERMAAPAPAPAPAPPPPPPPPPAAMASPAAAAAGAGAVTGVVRTEAGDPVPFASVIVPGTRISAVTDSAGRFTLPAPTAGADSAIVRRVGFRAATVPLGGSAGRTLGVVLRSNSIRLSEVVTTGVAASIAGCWRAELGAPAVPAVRRALAEPLRLTDEAAGGGWRWVRAGGRADAGATVARWRETADGLVEVEWPTPGGARLRLRAVGGALVGEARAAGGAETTPVALRTLACPAG